MPHYHRNLTVCSDHVLLEDIATPYMNNFRIWGRALMSSRPIKSESCNVYINFLLHLNQLHVVITSSLIRLFLRFLLLQLPLFFLCQTVPQNSSCLCHLAFLVNQKLVRSSLISVQFILKYRPTISLLITPR